MKTLTMIAVVAALAGGMSLAAAQNAPTSKAPISPNSINKGSEPGTPSGAESQSKATGKPMHVSGKGKYCSETSAKGSLNCVYASMSSCEKHSKSSNMHCVANPKLGTTGSRH
ncbi:MAG TPA: hypothetical protein VFL49_00135 [Pseudolabrys sp.]|nr:hypothetical protein [Pseudolabrys sp.]